MKSIKNKKKALEQFEAWLGEMEPALQKFLGTLPQELARQLDFSPTSLAVVEKMILERYPTYESTEPPEEAPAMDAFARYVGETFRKNVGGRWELRIDDPKYVFYGIPQLSGFSEKSTPICPLTMVSASTDRRTGKYLATILENCRRG
ncbi:hypothetical protein [Archangium sp.]|uniref:hypothetical protein n=1 Tax=Archangium sp. TaxID=1872627 RepID=UPI002EDAA33A